MKDSRGKQLKRASEDGEKEEGSLHDICDTLTFTYASIGHI